MTPVRSLLAGALLALFAGLAGIAVSAGFAAPPRALAPAVAPPPAALELLSAYNARDFGTPGWRRVRLELKNDTTITRTFSILHLWRQQGEELRSLVLLESPPGLRGTDYLLIESAKLPVGMALFLHLPAGQRGVLTIKPSRFEQGLLGSDFSYSDLRWRVPTAGYRLAVVGSSTLLGRPVWEIEAEPTTPALRDSTSWGLIHYYLCEKPSLLLGADYYRQRGAPPAKRLRIVSFEQRGKVWTPTRMVMEISPRRSSLLSLAESGFGAGPTQPELFLPEALPKNADRLLRSGPQVLIQGQVR
jgi:outer membrane lipoprotein-sorting protein